MRRTRVYISGPLTTGPVIDNVRRALEVAGTLEARGYAVYVPHTNIVWELVHPMSYRAALDHDFEWLDACDILYRMEGASHGADDEVRRSLSKKQPIYWSLDSLVACEPATR